MYFSTIIFTTSPNSAQWEEESDKKCTFVAFIWRKIVDSIQKFSIFAKILITCIVECAATTNAHTR